MMRVNKIYAILVAYNPQIDELYSNIQILKDHVDKVVLCNNSIYEIRVNDDSVIEFNFGENLGIAKAQSLGMKWAFENGADFILQIDQDSKPDPGMVEKLFSTFQLLLDGGVNVGLVGPVDYDLYTGEVSQPRINKGRVWSKRKDIIFVDSTLSSGSLISRKAYESVCGMTDELFIDLVDFDYCWRLGAAGFVVARCLNAKLAHRLGDGSKYIFGIFKIGIPSPFRHYYAFRNTLFLIRKSYPPIFWKVSSLMKLLLKYLFYRFLFNDGSERIFFMRLGIRDAFRGKMAILRSDD
jgi:rhamnosyltransferase